MPKYNYQPDMYIDRKEMGILINKAEYKEMQALLAFFWLTGARISEVLMQKCKHIKVENERVYITLITLKTRKKKGSFQDLRTIVFNKSAPFIDILLEWWLYRQEQNKEYIFNYSEGNPKTARIRIMPKIKKVDMRIYPHLFRHNRAKLLADAGATANQIQAFMGWDKISTADRYIKKTQQLTEPLANLIT